MLPSDLGLPSKFREFREPQLAKLEELVSVDERFNSLNLPTGFGKTSFYIAYSRLLSEERNRPVRTVILTATKALQTQILEDFESMGLVDIRGRNNYPCPLYGTCDKGYEHECHLSTTLGCKYTKKLDLASRSELIVTNYSYWLLARSNSTTALEPEGVEPVDLLICDEAHEAFEELARHMQIHIPYEWVNGFPLRGDGGVLDKEFEYVKDWSLEKRREIKSAQSKYESKANYKHDPEWLALERVRKQFVDIHLINEEWVYRLYDRKPHMEGRSGLDLDCIWPARYSGKLWSGVPKIVLVSGTLTQYTTRLLGIKEGFYTYERSTFPANRYPIIHIPTVKLNYQSTEYDYSRVVDRMDEIIGARLDRKGIVHTVSYDRAKLALSRSKYAKYMHFNESSRSSVETVARFKNSDPPAILVSPSVTTGWDFPDSDAEYVIVLKVPYPNRTDILMKARCDSDKSFYTHETVSELVQMCGRGMRHENDRCEVFIVDDSISLLRVIGKKFAPPGFFDSPRFRVSVAVPKPPTKLAKLVNQKEEKESNICLK